MGKFLGIQVYRGRRGGRGGKEPVKLERPPPARRGHGVPVGVLGGRTKIGRRKAHSAKSFRKSRGLRQRGGRGGN